MSENTHAYAGIAPCGCIRALSVDVVDAARLVAKDVAAMVRQGLTVERLSLDAVRARKLTRPGCEIHAPQPPTATDEMRKAGAVGLFDTPAPAAAAPLAGYDGSGF